MTLIFQLTLEIAFLAVMLCVVLISLLSITISFVAILASSPIPITVIFTENTSCCVCWQYRCRDYDT